MSNQCGHGQLARQCEICELKAELKEARKQGIERDIEAICEFIKAYEERKFQIMYEGGKLLSPVDFMLDYCKDLRRKAEEL